MEWTSEHIGIPLASRNEQYTWAPIPRYENNLVFELFVTSPRFQYIPSTSSFMFDSLECRRMSALPTHQQCGRIQSSGGVRSMWGCARGKCEAVPYPSNHLGRFMPLPGMISRKLFVTKCHSCTVVVASHRRFRMQTELDLGMFHGSGVAFEIGMEAIN